jgi:hypothetical protein
MSKLKSVQAEVEIVDDFSKLSEDQTLDLLHTTFSTLIAKLETHGVDPELISSILFAMFAERCADMDDRATFEAVLEEALETPWEDITIH